MFIECLFPKWNLSFADITGRDGLAYALTQSPFYACLGAGFPLYSPAGWGGCRRGSKWRGIFTPKCLGQLLLVPHRDGCCLNLWNTLVF